MQSHAQKSPWIDTTIDDSAFIEDLRILSEYIDQNHGGTEQYTTRQELEKLYRKLETQDGEISLRDAYYSFAQYVDALKDGHTWIMPSQQHSEHLLHTCRFIPFTIEVTGTEIYVDENFSNCHDLTSGTRILEIDGLPTREIVIQLLPYFTADGKSLSGKLGGIEGQFWWYYGLHFGFPESHTVRFASVNGGIGETKVVSVYMHDMINDASEIYCRYRTDPEETVTHRIYKETGILNVSNFTEWSLSEYKKAFIAALDDFHEAECKRMIIDVRGNGGGKEGVENLLLSCIAHTMYEKYDEVRIRNPIAPEYDHIKKRFYRKWEDRLYRAVEFRKNEEGEWLRRERFNRTFMDPEHRFEGDVFILIDRNVFSGASEFAALAADYATNCTLVGEETCGGYQGHTSGYYYDLILPNTGFIVHIPRIWFDLNVHRSDQGGVKPDIVLTKVPGLEDKDVVLEYILSSPLTQR